MKFLRRSSDRYGKLGKGIKKNQKWRRPTGRDNKMRDKRRGYPATVSIGYRTPREERGKIGGMELVKVENLVQLAKVDVKKSIVIVGKVGKKTKIEIVKKAKELGIKIANLKVKKILKEKKNEPTK